MGLPANRVDSGSVHAQRKRRIDKSSRLMARARSVLVRGVKRSYYLTQLHHQLVYMRGDLRQQEPIIVYQRGKVGSSSVYGTLLNTELGRPVFHVHFINAIERRHRQICSDLKLTPSAYFARSRHLVVSQYLSKEIKRGLRGKKWKVITLIRDPLKQKISSFFQLIDLIIPDFEQRCRDKTLSVEALTKIFLERYQPDRRQNDWFHRELQPVFDIDVFAEDFPRSRGYQIYSGERADLLLIRLEDLSRCATEAFGEFLGLTDFKLINENITGNKACAAVYQKFAKTVVLPDAYIDAVYDSIYARHFYTDAEIEQFKARYRRRVARA
ncbi:MAG: putative capsular polysaccharide synthesis family protein [Gammaproteobacteria bacterium]